MDSDDIIISALKQYKIISSDITNLSQIHQDEFGNLLIQLTKKIKFSKGEDHSLIPEKISKDLTCKYRESQKLVEHIKGLGYRSSINLNNILFPNSKDVYMILEFLIELITKEEVNVEVTEITETNLNKIKHKTKLLEFINENWILPEFKIVLEKGLYEFGSYNMYTLDMNYIKKFKKNILASNNSFNINDSYKFKSKELIQELYENSTKVKLLINEEFRINNKLESNNKLNTLNENKYYLDILNCLNKYLLKNKDESKNKENNTSLFDKKWNNLIKNRNESIKYFNNNFRHNSFINNIKLRQDKLNRLPKYQLYDTRNSNKDNTINTIVDKNKNYNITKDNKNIETTQHILNNNQNKLDNIKAKINNIENTYEQDKTSTKDEIKNFNNDLLNLENFYNNKKDEINIIQENILVKSNYIKNLNNDNIKLLKELEIKIKSIENLKLLKNDKIKENDLDSEIKALEEKYEVIVNNWAEYSNQMNYQINEIKEQVEVKKKEYNYKYDKISELKKEIHNLGNKISQKHELKNFLKEEFDKILDNTQNRNKYVNKITDLTKILNKEKFQWAVYLKELNNLEVDLENIINVIKRVDNEIEDKMFNDAKKNSYLKDMYSVYITIRDNYNKIQKNIIDTQIVKDKRRESNNKLEDYRIKLKNYDVKQLENQVQILKSQKQNNI